MPPDLIDAPRTTKAIHLYGDLATRFGPRFDLGVETAAGAIKALCVLVPGFRAAIQIGEYTVVRGSIETGLELSETMLHLRLPPRGELHIVPKGAGSKHGGFGKILIGAALLFAAWEFAPTTTILADDITAGVTATQWGATAFLGLSYGQIAIAGGLLLLAGVTSLLSPQPKKPYDGSGTESFLLGGQLNTTQQGVPVPVVYGTMMVGSVTVSTGYYAEDYNASSTLDSNIGSKTGVSSSKAGTSGAPSNPGQVQTSTEVFGSGSGGGGKGGGGSSRTPVEQPNTLRSKALVRLIDVLSEGPIGGLVNGAQSIFFNNTPLQNPDGTYNFQGVTWVVLLGLPDQSPIPGFSAAEQTVPLPIGGGGGLTVTASGGPHIEQISMATANGADALRVTVQLPAMYQEDTTHGDLNAAPPLAYQFDIRPTGSSTWTTVVRENIVGGKCMAPYQRSYRFPLPASTTGWDVRMTRLTPDSTSAALQNDCQWFAYTLVTDQQLIYPDTAYIAFEIDSSAFGSVVPNRAYEINGIQVAVPANYDPVNHAYATSGTGTSGGTWDLVTTKPATTDDPCWNLLDMLSNTRYGMGIKPAAIAATAADLYVISQYCNAQVPDGYSPTTTEVRYAVNCVMASQLDAYSVIQSMASAFRGMIHWAGGTIVVTADMPKPISKIVNQANVIDGNFTREGTSLKQRHTVYNVTWRDPANNYVSTVEVVEDFDQVATRTSIPADIVAFGCTSRGLARRLGKWMLYTERSATETLSYNAGAYQLDLSPGDIIVQSDPRVGARMGGRIEVAANDESGSTVIFLDAVFTPDPAQTYEIYLLLPDGTALLTPVQTFYNAPEANTSLLLSSGLTTLPNPNTEFLLLGTTSNPYQYQVVAVTEPGRGTFGVTALIADPGRFAWIEEGIKLEPNSFYVGTQLENLLLTPMIPVTNVTAHSTIAGIGTSTFSRIIISFTSTPDIRCVAYQAEAVMTADGSGNATGDANVGFFSGDASPIVIDNLPGGTYTFGVRSVGSDGRTSAWAYAESITTVQQNDAPVPPSALAAIGGTRRIQTTWTASESRDANFYEVWRSSSPTFTPGAGASLIGTSGGTQYFDSDSNTLVPNSTWYYWVRTVNTTGNYSTFAGPAGATTTLLVADDLADGIINTAKFAQGITYPILWGTAINGSETGLPSGPGAVSGSLLIFNTNDSQLYRWSGSAWTVYVQAGAIVGQITTTQIAPNSISTALLQADSVQTNNIAAGAITTNQIAANAITAGTIAAGAVGAEQIAAEAINTVNLAADFQLTESAQFGTAVIGTAQIQNLSVGTNKIGDSAVTDASAVATGGQSRGDMPSGVSAGGGGPYADDWRVAASLVVDASEADSCVVLFSAFVDPISHPSAADTIVYRMVCVNNGTYMPGDGQGLVFTYFPPSGAVLTFQLQVGFNAAADAGTPLFTSTNSFVLLLKK